MVADLGSGDGEHMAHKTQNVYYLPFTEAPADPCPRATLSSMVAVSHKWLLSTWREAHPNWDVL